MATPVLTPDKGEQLKRDIRNAVITVLIGAVIWFIPVPVGLKAVTWHLFAIFVAVIVGFILNPLPMGAVSMIALSFATITNTVSLGDALSGFSDSIIWLVVSSFLFAKAFIKTGLGYRIAYVLIRAIGDSTLKLGYTLVISDLIISPATPSNTARAGGILFPITKSLASAFDSNPGPTARRVGAYLMQTSYQANVITSAMFLTSMAGNPFIAQLAKESLGVQVDWGRWAVAAIVPGLLSLLVIPYFLFKVYPPEITRTPGAKTLAAEKLRALGPLNFGEKVLTGVFLLTLLLWSTSTITNIAAPVVGLLGVAILLGTKTVLWEEVKEEKNAWDTLVWMGALMSLASVLAKLNFFIWFAAIVKDRMHGVPWIPTLGVLLIIYIYSHYGFASLVPHIVAMYTAFGTVAIAAGAPKFLTAMTLAFASNLMMSLTHFAAGPSPIYFGAGFVDQGTWWKLGFYVSVINLIIWAVIGGLWWKLLGLW